MASFAEFEIGTHAAIRTTLDHGTYLPLCGPGLCWLLVVTQRAIDGQDQLGHLEPIRSGSVPRLGVCLASKACAFGRRGGRMRRRSSGRCDTLRIASARFEPEWKWRSHRRCAARAANAPISSYRHGAGCICGFALQEKSSSKQREKLIGLLRLVILKLCLRMDRYDGEDGARGDLNSGDSTELELNGRMAVMLASGHKWRRGRLAGRCKCMRISKYTAGILQRSIRCSRFALRFSSPSVGRCDA